MSPDKEFVYKAPIYVVIVRNGRRVKAYGPARRMTALRFRDAWREKYGKWREARVITLEKMTDEF